MIWESRPWKKEIAHAARSLLARKSQRRWPETSLVHVEKDIFLSAYAIRRLLEAEKLSDEVESISLSGMAHKSQGRPVDIMNWHRIDDLYDLSKGAKTRLGLRQFCDMVIHSFAFVPVMSSRNGLAGLFVTADRKKSERILYFDIDEVLRVLMKVANDEVALLAAGRDEKSGQMRIDRKSNRAPTARRKRGS